MSTYVVVRDMDGTEVSRMDVTGKSGRAIDRVEMGVLTQMDTDRFTVGVEES